MTTEKWVELELKGSFKVQIPADAKPSLQDEGTTAVIRLDDLGEATEVLISNYPLKKASHDRTEHAAALRDLVADFFARAVPKAVGHQVPFNVDVTEEEDLPWMYAEGVGMVDKERVWLVRIYARRGDDRFWIVHWNGPKGRTPVVMRIFVTFDPAG